MQRGVRQGCPLSSILFVIAVEMLGNSIRDHQSIIGINIRGKEYKLSQYADDTSCFVRDYNGDRLINWVDPYIEYKHHDVELNEVIL